MITKDSKHRRDRSWLLGRETTSASSDARVSALGVARVRFVGWVRRPVCPGPSRSSGATGAQGITADTCHLLVTGTETRQLLYAGLSRGRDANHLYLTVAGDGDPHTVITRDAVLPPAAGDLLTRIIGRDGAQRSAATAARTETDPGTRFAHAVPR